MLESIGSQIVQGKNQSHDFTLDVCRRLNRLLSKEESFTDKALLKLKALGGSNYFLAVIVSEELRSKAVKKKLKYDT